MLRLRFLFAESWLAAVKQAARKPAELVADARRLVVTDARVTSQPRYTKEPRAFE